ncbi:MAG TPA: type III-B CRISPR module RAMP protein Cmr6 [Isosphaeraceae bacterium]|nr:type III-B CRISPR module RAMP protein Cmr6 [Isosphaeraceae bacterium]
MSWSWRMPRDLPWATPYPLPRDTSDALLAEGQCENLGLLMERYLAFGDNRGHLQLLRELTDRRALVPDYQGQHELIAACDARWQRTAEELGAITFSARPHWRVIIGKGTNDLLEVGIALHPVFGFPIVPASALKGVSRAYAQWVLEAPEEELDRLLGKAEEHGQLRGDLLFLEGSPAGPPVVERDVINPAFGAYYRDAKTPPACYLSPSPIFFLAVGARSRYRFGVASLSGNQEAAERGVQWLQGALTELGVGAKSAAGYGYWELE